MEPIKKNGDSKTVKTQVTLEGDAAILYKAIKHKAAGVAVGLKLLYADRKLRELFFDEAQIRTLDGRLTETRQAVDAVAETEPAKSDATSAKPKVKW